MFKNVGRKIKNFAMIFVILEALAAIITGVCIWVDSEAWFSWLIIFLGPFAGLPIGWFIYGYGELICNSKQLSYLTYLQNLTPNNKKSFVKVRAL